MQHDFSEILYPEYKVVISSQDLDLADSWLHFRNPRQAVDYLESRNLENIVVGGGRDLGLAFLRENLIDEIVLDVQPVLFGTGTHLLGELEKPIQLQLISKIDLGHDAIRIHYRIC